jgi:hypothetical protein
MPLRNSYRFSDPGVISGGGLHSESKLNRVYRRLLHVYAVVHITYWFAVGCFLMLLPWQRFWDNNVLLYNYPGLRPVMASPFLKGAILGLGIVNLLIGLQELLQLGGSHRK